MSEAEFFAVNESKRGVSVVSVAVFSWFQPSPSFVEITGGRVAQ